MNSVILRAGTRYLAGLLILVSIFMLLRGHNEPGGGFIGGLIGSSALVLYALACGTKDARAALRIAPETVAILGLLIALVAGLIAALFADDFFTGQWLFLWPTEDDKGIPISTVLMFDIGVYGAVFGSVLSLVFTMEEEI